MKPNTDHTTSFLLRQGAMAVGIAAVMLFPVACEPQPTASTSATAAKPAASSMPASRPAIPTASKGIEARPADDADYVRDPATFPKRAGLQRRFLERSSINGVRDPVFFPGSSSRVLVTARVGASMGLWAVDLEAGGPATLIMETPKFDRKKKRSALNRSNWFIGTPQFSPDGKWVLFEGTVNRYGSKASNVLGMVRVSDGALRAVEVEGAGLARSPTFHPDGKTVLIAACNKLQTFPLTAFSNQVVQPTTLMSVESPTASRGVPLCPLHRPRYSTDGQRIVLELVGGYLTAAEHKRLEVPQSLNGDDLVHEPYIMAADGTGLKRLMSDAGYASIGGRLQAGGTKEPMLSPDGQRVVFAHGWRIIVASVDGSRAQAVTTSLVPGTDVSFHEGDPAFSADGKYVVAASSVVGSEEQPRRAPAGIVVIDLEALDVLSGSAIPKEVKKPIAPVLDHSAPDTP